MESATTLQCQNLTCLYPNLLASRFCEKCGHPLVKRYLRMLDDGWTINYYRPDSLIDNRYLVRYPGVVLDTKPALSPRLPEDIPDRISPYLKLIPYRLHVPQVYGYVPSPEPLLSDKMSLWLLEYGSIPIDGRGELLYGDLLPKLSDILSEMPVVRQFYYLLQIAKLWQPLQKKKVASSLLEGDLIRVNGRLVQLLELKADGEEKPTLKELGTFWENWSENIKAEGREYFDSLCLKLQTNEIDRIEDLIYFLEKTIGHYGSASKRTYQVYTLTDTGPSREHNEDACYPAPVETVSFENGTHLLSIVCDGIGGQEGGEIASALAIESLTAELAGKPDSEPAGSLTQTIQRAIATTNDVICQRNDAELRQERQRMGTTLVMAMARDDKMYVAHVGDSRVYWLTDTSCHQITLDDDLASREVRLGYLFYRDAIQYPNAGALVQALGMSGANNLHPTVSKFIVDEDCVFLLCSDGLSDHDRVEQYWDSEIVPLLKGERTIEAVGQNLLDLANRKNGHDNTTIALIHCRVHSDTEPLSPLNIDDTYTGDGESTFLDHAGDDSSVDELPTELSTAPTVIPEPEMETEKEGKEKPKFSPAFLITLPIVLILGIGAVIWSFTPKTADTNSQPAPGASPLP